MSLFLASSLSPIGQFCLFVVGVFVFSGNACAYYLLWKTLDYTNKAPLKRRWIYFGSAIALFIICAFVGVPLTRYYY